jgi:hypothetical protein
MTASVGGEVHSNPVSSVVAAQLSAGSQDAGRQDLGDLVKALGRGHQVGVEGAGQSRLTRCLIPHYMYG